MDDFEYVADISGEAGGLAKAMPLFGRMNNSMLSLTDSLLGPDGTDTFDASCNTCLHFERRPMTPLEKSERNVFGMPGRCRLKQCPTTGWQRGQYCGFENATCYKNRRTGLAPHELVWPGAPKV